MKMVPVLLLLLVSVTACAAHRQKADGPLRNEGLLGPLLVSVTTLTLLHLTAGNEKLFLLYDNICSSTLLHLPQMIPELGGAATLCLWVNCVTLLQQTE